MNEQVLRQGLARARRLVCAVAACGLLSACTADAPQESRAPQSIVADVIVAVTNQTSHDKRIVLAVGTVQHPLGEVPGHSSRSFSLPSSAGDSTSELQLEARQGRDSSGIRSSVFRIASGQRIVWTLDATGHGALVTR